MTIEFQPAKVIGRRASLPAARLAYLDMTKGILVLLMVVYHSLNYTNQYHLAFRYLSFLPLSFILITGFLLSSVYSPRYSKGDRTLIRRLLLRGGRLLLLFTALNIAAQYVRSPAYGQSESVGVGTFFQRWHDVFVVGSSSIATFDVLLPIAYLLLLSPILIALAHRILYFLPVVTALLVAGCALLDLNGVALVNLNFVSAGVLGMLIGRWLSNPAMLGRYLWLTLVAYAVYFPFGLSRGWIFLIQLCGAIAALAFICASSVRLGETGWYRERIIRVGVYSLLAYILQIGFLQLLSRVLGRPDPISVQSLILFSTTLILMTLMIEATEWLRRNSAGVDRAYKAVFA